MPRHLPLVACSGTSDACETSLASRATFSQLASAINTLVVEKLSSWVVEWLGWERSFQFLSGGEGAPVEQEELAAQHDLLVS